MDRHARARSIAECFRVRIRFRDVLVLVTLITLDETRGLLVEDRAGRAKTQVTAADVRIGEQVELAFVDAGVIAPAGCARPHAVGAESHVVELLSARGD